MRLQFRFLRKSVSFYSSSNNRPLFSLHGQSRFQIDSRNLGLTPARIPVPIISKLQLMNRYSTPAGAAALEDESREFLDVFPDIVRDLTEAEEFLDIPNVAEWYEKVLQYNVPHGKLIRGLSLVAAYRELIAESELTPQKLRLARIMGWCVEMLQSFILLFDDMIDESDNRRGQPCWYRVDNVGTKAVNDGILVNEGIYVILKKYFRNESYYLQVIEMFHDMTLKTTMGQSLDMLTAKSFKMTRKLDQFTMNRYLAIAKYKTGYYSVLFPIATSLYMAGILDAERHRIAKDISLEIGNLLQIQDDYLDCFGDKNTIGKSCTDILEGKCTWLLAVALERANDRQRALLEECYGCADKEKIETVKNIYTEIGLPSIYAAYEEETYTVLVDRIQQLPSGLSQNLFFKPLDRLYKRQK